VPRFSCGRQRALRARACYSEFRLSLRQHDHQDQFAALELAGADQGGGAAWFYFDGAEGGFVAFLDCEIELEFVVLMIRAHLQDVSFSELGLFVDLFDEFAL